MFQPTTYVVTLPEGMYSRVTPEWRMDEFVRVLNAKVVLANAEGDYQAQVRYYLDKPGRNFTRVVRDTGNQRFVECFVENSTGKVLKSAGWRSPAKDKDGLAYRWNLMDADSRRLLYGSIRGSLGASYYKGIEQATRDIEAFAQDEG